MSTLDLVLIGVIGITAILVYRETEDIFVDTKEFIGNIF